ncbi:MAG: DUF2183 domain-containing protein [Candidatus Riflebacteria bacterium]|nr:DUF2183 domain-containing protein [Candidatus Riflebacteria bacterium]
MKKGFLFCLILILVLIQTPGQCNQQDEKEVPRLLYSGSLPLPDGQMTLFGRIIWDEDYKEPLINKRFAEFFKHRSKLFSFQISFGNLTLQMKTDNIGDFDYNIPASMASELKLGDKIVFSAAASYPEFVEKLPVQLPVKPNFLIISDIDDTVLVTQVLEKWQALKNTFFLNWKNRKPVPGTPDIYRKLAGGTASEPTNLLVFLSGSPIYLAPRLEGFFQINQFPSHTSILRRLGIKEDIWDRLLHKTSQDKDPADIQEYKLTKLAALFRSYPDLPIILLGDSGEKDPETFQKIVETYPGHVRVAIIHKVTLQDSDSPRYSQLKKEVPFILWDNPDILTAALQQLGLIQ